MSSIKVLIWNSEKVDAHTFEQPSSDEYIALMNLERKTGCSYSSKIKVKNIEQLRNTLEAVYQETDVDLSYQLLW